MSGSVFKRNGIWTIRYDLPPGPDGKRRQKMKSCSGMTRKQAEEELRRILLSIDNGTHVEPSSQFFGEYIREWLRNRRPSLGEKTAECYEEVIEWYIVPMLGEHTLGKLQAQSIQAFYTKLLESGRRQREGGLSPKTVRNIHGIIHAALDQAMRWRLIPFNPANEVTPPKAIRPEIRTASAEEVLRVIEAVERSKYRIPYSIVLATGMRRGEALGLRWEDFNSENRTLVVRRSISVTGDHRIFPKEPKTGRARVVAAPDYLVAILDEHRRLQQQSDELVHGCRKSNWICADVDGGLPNPDNVGKVFAQLARTAGVNITLHGLRHTQATQLIMAGVPVKVVSERLGHSTITITQDLYTHVLPQMQREAAEVIDRILNLGQAQIAGAREQPVTDGLE